jgi:hypothetical protein
VGALARTEPGGRPRHRYARSSTGLLALSAALLAASTVSSAAPATPGPPPEEAPRPAESTGAGGNTPPAASFPGETVTTDRIVHKLPGGYGPGTAGIPATMLDAYRRAATRTNLVQPRCRIPFELVAAIGKVESGHARGGQVDVAGTTLEPILGPVLAGGAFAAIRDTDGGALDGDPTWDRAVGPMQFIPGTWAGWQADGNVDGRLDPQNVYDASLAAARYLCAADRDLGTPAGLDAAVLSYNNSTSYLSLVRSWLSVYRLGALAVPARAPPPTPPKPAKPPKPSAPPSAPPSSPPSTPPSEPPSAPPSDPPTRPSDPPPTRPAQPPPTRPSTGPTVPTRPPTRPQAEPPAEPPRQASSGGLLCGITGLLGGLLGTPSC